MEFGRKRRSEEDQLASYVWRDRAFRAREDTDGYDARRYASQVLRALRMANVSVALFHGTRGVQVNTGRAWGGGPDQRWATVSVAPWATREEVATALALLAGRAQEPLLIESLLALPAMD